MKGHPPDDSALPGTPGGGECSNPNCRPRAIRPVHDLPPRRYAGEDPPSEGSSEAELACRALLREYRRIRRGVRGPGRAYRPHRAGPGAGPVRVAADARESAGKHGDRQAAELGARWDPAAARWVKVGARPLPEIDPDRIEPGDELDQGGARLDEHGRKLAPKRSRFRGVYWDGPNQVWRARIYLRGEYHHAGTSRDEEAAARMVDALALRLFGESAVLNFPLTPAEGGGP